MTPVTVTEIWQPPTLMLEPLLAKVMTELPGVAVIVPVQVVLRPLGLAIRIAPGRLIVKGLLRVMGPVLLLPRVTVNVLWPLGAMEVGRKACATVGY